MWQRMIGYLLLNVLAIGIGAIVFTELAASPLVFAVYGEVMDVRGKLSLIREVQQKTVTITINPGFQFEDVDKFKIESDDKMREKGERATVLINCVAARTLYHLQEGDYPQPCNPPVGTPAISYPPPSLPENIRSSRPKKGLELADLDRLNDIEEKTGNLKLDQVITLYLRAEIYTAWNLTERVEELDKLQSALLQQKNDGSPYLYVFRRAGDLCRASGMVKEAESLYQRSISLAQKSTDQLEEAASSYSALSEIYREQGDTQRAKQSKLKAADLYRQIQLTDKQNRAKQEREEPNQKDKIKQ